MAQLSRHNMSTTFHLACLEGYMTQRPSSQPQPTPGPFIVGGVTVGRSSNPHSALDAITRQSSSSSSQRLQSQVGVMEGNSSRVGSIGGDQQWS
eukprot:scaffold40368_cov19-Tisochrysis_lutea.AAC.2